MGWSFEYNEVMVFQSSDSQSGAAARAFVGNFRSELSVFSGWFY
jgi:hypothetical protein